MLENLIKSLIALTIYTIFLKNNIVFMDAAEPWQLGFQDPATPIMEGIINFHNYIMIFLTGVGIFVMWLLARCLILYSEERNNDEIDNFTHATTVEIVWTIVPAIILAMWKIQIPGTETVKQAGWVLWPIFGATNQMLAALILMVLTIYFWKKGKKVILLFIPMIIIMFIALTSLIMKTIQFKSSGNNLLFGLGLILILLIFKMIYEGLMFYIREKRHNAK